MNDMDELGKRYYYKVHYNFNNNSQYAELGNG